MRVYAELYLSVMGALSVMGVYTLVSRTLICEGPKLDTQRSQSVTPVNGQYDSIRCSAMSIPLS
jgi:hypothetical protein